MSVRRDTPNQAVDPERDSARTRNPCVREPYEHEWRLPGSPSTWLRQNITLGNILVVITMLLAAGAWVRSTEAQGVALKDLVRQAEARVQRLERDTMSKELFVARLDAISERLKAIEDRLTRIERQAQ